MSEFQITLTFKDGSKSFHWTRGRHFSEGLTRGYEKAEALGAIDMFLEKI